MDRKVVGALVLTLALASCGSSTRPKGDWRMQANTICRQRTSQLASLQKKSKDFRAFAAAALPVASKSLEELQKIAPPPSIKAEYGEFLAGQRALTDQARSILKPRTAGARPPASETAAEAHRRVRLINSLGLKPCT